MLMRSWSLAAVVSVLMLGACGKDETPPAAPTPAPTTARSATIDMSAATKAAAGVMPTADDAKKLMDSAAQYIKDHKIELADDAVTQLEKMKPNLPPEMQPRVDQLRQALNALKSAGSMPALPKLPM